MLRKNNVNSMYGLKGTPIENVWLCATLFQQSQTTGEQSHQNAVFQQARTQSAKPDHAEKPCVCVCVPRVWRASRATVGARMDGLRGLVVRIVCVPAEKLHFGLTFRLWLDFAEIM